MNITFKEYLTEKQNYTWIQRLFIALWGDRMYLSYDGLPKGKGNPEKFYEDGMEYLSLPKDSEDRMDLGDWFIEGASYDGVKTLTKDLYDNVMSSAQEKAKKDMVLYKYGDNKVGSPRWLSMTIKKDSHGWMGAENEYSIKAGTPVIWPQKLADSTEVIIHSKHLLFIS